MDYLKIAKSFGLNVTQFAEVIGYRKQSIYNGIRKTKQAQEAIERLKDYNDILLEKDIEEAKKRHSERTRYIEAFRESLRECGNYG